MGLFDSIGKVTAGMLGIRGGLFDGLFGGGGVSASTLRRRGRNVISSVLEPSDRLYFGQAQRQMEAIPGAIQGGYRLARKNVGEAFRGAQTSVIDQANVAQGNALNSLTQAGYSGAGSIAANMRLGIGYGTSRAIQDIQDRVAQIGADLATNEARDVAGARSGLAQFYMQRAAAERQRNMLHFDLETAQPSNMQGPLDLAGLGQLAASIAPFFAMA